MKKLLAHFFEVDTDCELGRGSFSKVFEGTYEHQVVACKTELNDSTSSLEIEWDFLEELLTKPPSEQLIKYFGVREFKQKRYLVFEKVDMHLVEFFEKSPQLDTRVREKLQHELIEAGVYFQKNKIIHNDLHKHNVMIRLPDTLKVGDFGSSVHGSFSDSDVTQLQSGAPEKYRKPTLCTHKTDIFSIGCLLVYIGEGTFFLKTISKNVFEALTHYGVRWEKEDILKFARSEQFTELPKKTRKSIQRIADMLKKDLYKQFILELCHPAQEARPAATEVRAKLAQPDDDSAQEEVPPLSLKECAKALDRK